MQGLVVHVTTMIDQLSSWDEFCLSVSTSLKRCEYTNPSSRHMVNDMTNEWINMLIWKLSEEGCLTSKTNSLENRTMNISRYGGFHKKSLIFTVLKKFYF